MRNFLAAVLALVLSGSGLWAYDYASKPNYDLFQRQTVRVIFVDEDSQEPVGLCSGVYIGNRHVLTAGHCAQVPEKNEQFVIFVRTLDSSRLIYAETAKAVKDKTESGLPRSDLGLLRLETDITGVPPAPISCRIPDLGEDLYAVGMPSGLPWTVTKGSVTTWVPRGDLEGGRWLQLDMTIVGGNSGGPVFDRNGNLVGIIAHIKTLGFGIPTGHSYAVSSREVCKFLDDEETNVETRAS